MALWQPKQSKQQLLPREASMDFNWLFYFLHRIHLKAIGPRIGVFD